MSITKKVKVHTIKNVRAVIVLFMPIFVMVGCGSNPAHESYAVPERSYSQQCYITQKESYIWLEQEHEWLALPLKVRQQFEQENVNWLEENVFIASLGQKPTAGFNIELSQWLLEQNYWQVTRIIDEPKPGSMQAMMISSPCVLVKIPKTIKSFSLINPEGRILGRWPY